MHNVFKQAVMCYISCVVHHIDPLWRQTSLVWSITLTHCEDRHLLCGPSHWPIVKTDISCVVHHIDPLCRQTSLVWSITLTHCVVHNTDHCEDRHLLCGPSHWPIVKTDISCVVHHIDPLWRQTSLVWSITLTHCEDRHLLCGPSHWPIVWSITLTIMKTDISCVVHHIDPLWRQTSLVWSITLTHCEDRHLLCGPSHWPIVKTDISCVVHHTDPLWRQTSLVWSITLTQCEDRQLYYLSEVHHTDPLWRQTAVLPISGPSHWPTVKTDSCTTYQWSITLTHCEDRQLYYLSVVHHTDHCEDRQLYYLSVYKHISHRVHCSADTSGGLTHAACCHTNSHFLHHWQGLS